MATDDLREFVEDRLRAFDPDIDLEDGSPAQDQVVDPIVRRFTPDPFEMDLDQYVTVLLEQEYPDTNFREGSGVRDLLVKPANILLDPIHREVQLLKQAQSLALPELLAPDEADALVANVFITRQLGDLSSGVVRLYFNSPIAVNISVGNVCFTSDGLRFIPTTLQSISAESMVFNQSGNLYYFDINVTAEQPGDEYNIDKTKVVGITNMNVAVRVTNLAKFAGGLPEETTQALVERAETSITERSLVVPRGVSARLFSQFTALAHLQVIGHSDPEMQRDIISGGDMGPVLLAGQDGYTEDDGDGDAFSSILRSRFTDFTDLLAIGPVSDHVVTVNEINSGTDGQFISSVNIFKSATIKFEPTDVGAVLLTFDAVNASNNGYYKILTYNAVDEVVLQKVGGAIESSISWVLVRPHRDFPIVEVISATELKVVGDMNVDKQMLAFAIRKKLLTISGIPGGILFSADREAIEIRNDEVHIGGASDFYVKGSSLEPESLVLSAVSDEEPVIRRLTGSTLAADTEFFRDTAINFELLGAKTGMSLVIENGPDAGTYSILRVGISPAGLGDITYLQIDPPIANTATDLRYKVVDTLDVNLRLPKNVRGEGDDGETVAGVGLFTTTAAVDFLTLGTLVGDVLRIKSGFDKRDFTIQAIGGTGNRELTLSGVPTSTVVDLEWEVFKAQDGLIFPLIRLTSLDILDSSSQPTGDVIPFADPVDIRAEAFANVGNGIKLTTIEAVTGIVGTANMDTVSYPLAATTLNFRINDVAPGINVFLTGAADKDAVVDAINAAIPNIAELITVSGESRLSIRSLDRWIQVSANAQNANIGLNAAGEDNRQIKAGDVTNWLDTSFNLRSRTDSVYITTGDNVGIYHLVSVESGRVLVVGFDEADGKVRFLQPNVDVSLTIGSRSIGSARVYFMDPTSFQVRGAYRPALKNTTDEKANLAVFTAAEITGGASIPADEEPVTYFTAEVDGVKYRFVPDPELKHVVLPDPDSDVPNNLSTAAASPVLTSTATVVGTLGKNSRAATLDFLTREIRVGDLVEPTVQPIQGTNDLAVFPVLTGFTLILAVDGAPPKTLTFSSDVTTLSKLTTAINDFWGVDIAFIETIGALKFLRLEGDFPITIKKNGTANAPTRLGFSTIADTKNTAKANIDGYYAVTAVGGLPFVPTEKNKLTVTPAVNGLGAGESQHFRVLRPGVQRLHSTAMSKQQELGLYYMDVELISEGPGNQWNIPDNTEMTAEGYESDGYRLVVIDPNLSYSTEEDVKIELSKRILAVGQSDRPDQATLISSQNLQVNYERSALAASIQSFVSSDLERVLNASLLVRHLFPTFVHFEMSYRGGSSEDVVTDDVVDFLAGLGPDDRVESSDLQDLARRRGSNFVVNPLEILAVAHDRERRIAVDRSFNFVTKGRLSAWFPGIYKVKRDA